MQVVLGFVSKFCAGHVGKGQNKVTASGNTATGPSRLNNKP